MAKIVKEGLTFDDVLLVPLDQFKLVRKFVGAEGVAPKLNKTPLSNATALRNQRRSDSTSQKCIFVIRVDSRFF